MRSTSRSTAVPSATTTTTPPRHFAPGASGCSTRRVQVRASASGFESKSGTEFAFWSTPGPSLLRIWPDGVRRRAAGIRVRVRVRPRWRPVRGRRFRLLYSRQPTAPTACQLPLPPVARALLNYTLMYSNGTECTGSSLAETLGGRGLLLTVGDCGPDVTPGTRVYYNTINHTNTTWQTIIGLVGWKYSVHCQSSDWRLKLSLLLIGKR